MWFGNGTSINTDKEPTNDASLTGKTTQERAQALAHGAIAALPAAQRNRPRHNTTTAICLA